MTNWFSTQKKPVQVHLMNHGPFIFCILVLALIAYAVYPHPQIAMWFGFAVAGYSTIANDSIQTLGTFISSNKKMPWWMLWIFIGGILVLTFVGGWVANSGDVAFGRLDRIPQPESFAFLTIAAPIILLILTKLRMPVSTTFLLLSAFSSTVVIQKMLMKTFVGYLLAFVIAIVVWGGLAMVIRKYKIQREYNKKRWKTMQICSTSLLWWAWLMQDTANVSVFLPRGISFHQLLVVVVYLFLVVGLIMYRRGGEIQTIVTEKTDVVDIRAATIIDLVYAVILLIFKYINNIPMSTTWVFLGLLAGREIALTLLSKSQEPYKTTAKLVVKDIFRASAGLAISLIIVLFLM
jgi:hypothetical protein